MVIWTLCLSLFLSPFLLKGAESPLLSPFLLKGAKSPQIVCVTSVDESSSIDPAGFARRFIKKCVEVGVLLFTIIVLYRISIHAELIQPGALKSAMRWLIDPCVKFLLESIPLKEQKTSYWEIARTFLLGAILIVSIFSNKYISDQISDGMSWFLNETT